MGCLCCFTGTRYQEPPRSALPTVKRHNNGGWRAAARIGLTSQAASHPANQKTTKNQKKASTMTTTATIGPNKTKGIFTRGLGLGFFSSTFIKKIKKHKKKVIQFLRFFHKSQLFFLHFFRVSFFLFSLGIFFNKGQKVLCLDLHVRLRTHWTLSRHKKKEG